MKLKRSTVDQRKRMRKQTFTCVFILFKWIMGVQFTGFTEKDGLEHSKACGIFETETRFHMPRVTQLITPASVCKYA